MAQKVVTTIQTNATTSGWVEERNKKLQRAYDAGFKLITTVEQTFRGGSVIIDTMVGNEGL